MTGPRWSALMGDAPIAPPGLPAHHQNGAGGSGRPAPSAPLRVPEYTEVTSRAPPIRTPSAPADLAWIAAAHFEGSRPPPEPERGSVDEPILVAIHVEDVRGGRSGRRRDAPSAHQPQSPAADVFT